MITAQVLRLQVLLTALAGDGRRRTADARGVIFIEHTILAAIAVAIGFMFRDQLGTLFNTLLGRLDTAININ